MHATAITMQTLSRPGFHGHCDLPDDARGCSLRREPDRHPYYIGIVRYAGVEYDGT